MDGQSYELTIAGLRRDLPIVEVAPGVRIAAFVMLGDVELVEACARALAERLQAICGASLRGPDAPALVGPEAKVVPLLHSLAARLGHPRYVVCRKSVKGYMHHPVETDVRSITTAGTQRLVLDGPDAQWLRGRDVILVDDVVSTGGTLQALQALMGQVGARSVARVAALVEGDGVPGVEALGRLPVWRDR